MNDNFMFFMILGLIGCLLLGILLGNVFCKTGKGVGIMSGTMADYRYIEVPAELSFKSIHYQFTPSNGFVNVSFEPRSK